MVSIGIPIAIGLILVGLRARLGVPAFPYRKDWTQVMIYKHVSGCFVSDKDISSIPVMEKLADSVENAPPRHHVVFIGVVLDVWDDS